MTGGEVWYRELRAEEGIIRGTRPHRRRDEWETNWDTNWGFGEVHILVDKKRPFLRSATGLGCC